MSSKTLIFVALAGIMTVPMAFGQTTAFADPAYAGNQTWTGNLGNDFTVNTPIIVTSLGAFHGLLPAGFAGTVQVAIYNLSGTQVAGPVTFTGTAGTVSGGDNFQTITPVILPAGSYSVVANFSGADPDGNSTVAGYQAATTNTGGGLISFTGVGRYDSSGSLELPLNVGVFSFNAGTFNFTAVAAPTLSKAFGAVSIPIGGSTGLTFTLSNPNPAALTGLVFVDPLPTGLLVSTPNGLTGACGGGIITATAGGSAISLTGATLAGGATCTFRVNVTSTVSANGLLTNVTSGVISAAAPAGAPATARLFVGSDYQVTYTANLGIGDSVINITNTGANGAGLGSGTTASVTGAICANVYVFTPDEQIVACCSCPVTPNGLVSLSAQKDLISNTLTQKVAPSSIVIKLVATAPVGGTCNQSASAVGSATLAGGMVALGTKLHANTSPTGGFGVTETEFTSSSLSAGEQARLAYTCGIVINQGSGNGVCASCRLGGLGAVQQ